MKTLERMLLGLGLVLLLAVAGAAVAVTPRITWTVDPSIPKSMAPGESTTHTVTLTHTGVLPIPLTKQLRIDVEGDLADYDYVTFAQPTFPNPFKRNATVTFNLTVSVPKGTPARTLDGSLVLKRYIGKRVTEVWRAEALPVSIAIRSYALLNDTGITLCGDADRNDLSCPVDGFPGQDAEFGRDVTHNDDSDGHAGFSFTKLDVNGNPLAIQNGTWDEAGSEDGGTKWSCVRDNVTGLVWEVKTKDGGLRDEDWTYSWYNPDPATNGGGAGTQNGGSCIGSPCDTEGFVQAVNAQAQGLCGANDWRMPELRELMSIMLNDGSSPTVGTTWFTNTQSDWFWSSSPDAYNPVDAWLASFDVGYGGRTSKNATFHVRLVRAGK